MASSSSSSSSLLLAEAQEGEEEGPGHRCQSDYFLSWRSPSWAWSWLGVLLDVGGTRVGHTEQESRDGLLITRRGGTI